MAPIESILYMMWRGLAVGVLISAPMGPVGMLCIQRTLDKGRKAGFFTGIGVALSDLFYCLLTGFGLSFIEDFLHQNQNIIQLFGSMVLVAFAIYMIRKSPSSSLRRPVPQNVSAKKNILGGFLFTFSNPLIIFLIIGLFAQFNFTAPEIKGGFYAVGYVFILAGALGWWYGVTYLIEKVRGRFNMRSMKRLNVGIGIVILVFAGIGMGSGIIGLTSAEAHGARNDLFSGFMVHRLTPRYASGADSVGVGDDSRNARRLANSGWRNVSLELFDVGLDEVSADCRADSLQSFRLDFKAANHSSHPGRRYVYTDSASVRRKVKSPPWSLVAVDERGSEMRFEFYTAEYSPTPLSSQATVFARFSNDGLTSEPRPIADGINAADGLNHFRLIREGEVVSLYAGDRSLKRVGEFPIARFGLLRSLRIEASPGSDVSVCDAALRLEIDPGSRRSHLSEEEIAYRLRHSVDPTEGRWRLLDHTVDDPSARLGGDYTVAIVRRPDGDYEIVYLGGAVISGRAWQPGMLKGLLRPTGHEGVYDLEWRDSEGLTLRGRLTAQRESMSILTFHFPELGSRLRFGRLEQP